MISSDQLIGKGMAFPLNLSDQGTLILTGGWDLIRSSINNLLAYIIGDRYFLGEFGASCEDILEDPNDEISSAVIQHRLTIGLMAWDPRIVVNLLSLERDNQSNVTIAISVSLKGTDLSELFIIPVTVNTVQ